MIAETIKDIFKLLLAFFMEGTIIYIFYCEYKREKTKCDYKKWNSNEVKRRIEKENRKIKERIKEK